MRLTSSRNQSVDVDFKYAVLKGLAEDGGLFVPSRFPRLTLEDLDRLARGMGKGVEDLQFPELVEIIWNLYAELDKPVLHEDIVSSYEHFPIPLIRAGELNILELFNGGSAAFKDVALSLFPKIVRQCMESEGATDSDVFFITATSGDTGKAAMEGIKHQPGMKLAVIYPSGGVSDLQERQMLSEKAENIKVIPINGDFDAAQRAVKEVLLSGRITNASSCNSINIARLVTQISYYYHGFISFHKNRAMANQLLDFIVPSGNFGNILAGYYAKAMGLPIGKLVAATNKNDVLWEFINTGVYDGRRQLFKTTSPSMDIIISSNIERLLYHKLGADQTRQLMAQLAKTGQYTVDPAVLSDFAAYRSNDEEASAMIKAVYEQTGYIMDPHTACGAVAWEKSGKPANAVLLSTASPFKFPLTIINALEIKVADEREAFQKLAELTPVHPALANIYEKELKPKTVTEIQDVFSELLKFQGGGN